MTFKPAPPHTPLKAPAICLCVECCKIVAGLRCPARDSEGRQCGDYRHRSKRHTMLVMTVFAIAAERLDTHAREVDAVRWGGMPT